MKPVANSLKYIDTPPTTIHGGTPALDLWLGRMVKAVYAPGLHQRRQITGVLRKHEPAPRGGGYFVVHGDGEEWVNITVSAGVTLATLTVDELAAELAEFGEGEKE